MFKEKSPKLKRTIQDGWASRKYRAAWMLTWLILGISFIGYLIVIFMSLTPDLFFITGSAALTFIGTIWGVYFSANVTQKFAPIYEQEEDLENPEV